jgi:predicted amidophosphoribosyltransferase
MTALESLSCPQCGSVDLTENSPNRFRCDHCGATSTAAGSSAVNALRILEWVCPGCGFDNEKGASFCGNCRKSLKKICPKCVEKYRWDLKYCPECGFSLNPNEFITYTDIWEGHGRMLTLTSSRLIYSDSDTFDVIPLMDLRKVKSKKTMAVAFAAWCGSAWYCELTVAGNRKPYLLFSSTDESHQQTFGHLKRICRSN